MSTNRLPMIDLAQLAQVTGGRRPDDGGNYKSLLGGGVAGEARARIRPNPSPGPSPTP